jgi:hypothetical protein
MVRTSQPSACPHQKLKDPTERNFGAPETEYKGLRVCATGKITSFRGVPEIIATERGQIEVQK